MALSLVHTSNNVEATLSNATSRTILSTKSNVASTLLPKRTKFTKNSFDIVAKGSNVEATFDIVEATFNYVVRLVAFEMLFRHCCFDTVAGEDGALQ